MSTKVSIAYRQDAFHLYEDLLDPGMVYLRLDDVKTAAVKIEDGRTEVTVAMTAALARTLGLVPEGWEPIASGNDGWGGGAKDA
jgi:hypothetical protein